MSTELAGPAEIEIGIRYEGDGMPTMEGPPCMPAKRSKPPSSLLSPWSSARSILPSGPLCLAGMARRAAQHQSAGALQASWSPRTFGIVLLLALSGCTAMLGIDQDYTLERRSGTAA